MRNNTEVPPDNTCCGVAGCRTVAETYMDWLGSRIPVCGLHAAAIRARKGK